MKLTILVVGRVRGSLTSAVEDFESRAGHYWKLEVVEVDGGPGKGDGPDPISVRRAEGDRLARRVPAGTERWALTREGRTMDSTGLARELDDRMTLGAGGVTFLIGGAYGLDEQLVRECDLTLRLSSFTLPHELARLVLAEQLYRAGTILRNEPYHKGPT